MMQLKRTPTIAWKQNNASASLFDDWNNEDMNSLLKLASAAADKAIAAIAVSENGFLNFKLAGNLEFISISDEFQLLASKVFFVEDLLHDIRFAAFPLIEIAGPVRFFFSYPLNKGSKTNRQFHLCLFHSEPKKLSKSAINLLGLVAKMGVRLLKTNKQNLQLKKNEEKFKSSKQVGKLVAKQLDQQKKFYENILNKLPTDIAVFDADHKYLFVNPGAISVKEYRKYIIGKDDYDYAEFRQRDKSTADYRREQFLRVKHTGKEIRWEDSLKGPAGNTITHLRRMFPVHDNEGKLSFVIGFGIDITDRKTMEEKQAVLVEQLSAKNIQLIDFCNIVSHNLRGPLVNMSLLVNYIEESTDTEDQILLISKLHPVIDNLNTTFNELVESIQIKQDLEIKSEHILLIDYLQSTIEGLGSIINKSGAHFEVDFDSSMSIFFPPKYLHSIFYNLLSNSLKYQSPNRSPLIKINYTKINGKALLSITDNGLGIDLIKHSENFFKIGKVFHRHPNAKGFGLYMTKTQVEAMDGKIWVESTPDIGSTFFIEFSNQ